MTTPDQPAEANAFVAQRSRKTAQFDESTERRFTEAHRVMNERIKYLTYDEYASGKSCPACERPLLDEPQSGGLLRTQTEVDADNADSDPRTKTASASGASKNAARNIATCATRSLR